jgi:predicted DNA-binding transcriptional regulator AlpA
MEAIMASTILRPKQLRHRLGVSKSTVRRMVLSGALRPPIKISARACGWPEPWIDEFVEQRIAAGSHPCNACAVTFAPSSAPNDDVSPIPAWELELDMMGIFVDPVLLHAHLERAPAGCAPLVAYVREHLLPSTLH